MDDQVMTSPATVKPETRECLRLTLLGGPDHYSSRGLTLMCESSYEVAQARQCFNLELVIASQSALLQRAERIYNKKTIDEERALLQELESLRSLPRREQRYRMLDLLMPE
jgi:hypothetical protein